MKILEKCLIFGLCLSSLAACSQQNYRVKLGRLQMGATVSFVRDSTGEWGIEVSCNTLSPITQHNPAQIEVFQGEENITDMAVGYQSVQKEGNTVIAKAKVADGSEAAFDIEDQWSISGDVLSLNRKVDVTGTKDSAGFYSAIRLSVDPAVKWEDVDYLAPGLLYGKPHTSASAAGGSMYYNANTAGSCTYAAVPFLVKMSEETSDNEYLESAIRAGHYVWNTAGNQCFYLGATGTSTVADKESGMLSLEAFLSLYENTKDSKWLEYAKSAGDYTESWIWIWNVPMPIGANSSDLGWKPGVPTIGVNGIGSNDVGGVDQYLDWAVPSYARLYKYTGDEHYLDVAYILLHGTKTMLALPGRTYDLLGPGWQQENWSMGRNRGNGSHRSWLPWVSVNHLHGITGLEEFDPELFQQLSNGK